MKTITIQLSPETYVLCEKAAKLRGISVRDWLLFLLADRVGHTHFDLVG